MKLYLFGGAETDQGQAPLLKKLIKDVILLLKPQQILHIPFARLHHSEEEWKEGWFLETMKDEMQKSGMKYGVGIDSITALVVDPSEFPKKWEKMGGGSVDVICP